jgi:hypothetical protein
MSISMSKTADEKAVGRHNKPTVIIPFTPTPPDVNLLPPRVFDAVQAKKAQRQLAVAGGVLVLLVAGAFVGQTAQIMVANHALNVETDRGVVLDKQVRDLAPVKVFYDGVKGQKTTVQKTMARELYFSDVTSELRANSPGGVQLETMTVSLTSDAGTTSSTGSVCPAANPFSPVPMVTCVQFTGTANRREDVAVFLTNLNSNAKFANVYVPVTDSGDGKAVTFNGSVGITEKFFTNRYADDAYLLKNDVGAK